MKGVTELYRSSKLIRWLMGWASGVGMMVAIDAVNPKHVHGDVWTGVALFCAGVVVAVLLK